MKRISKKFQTVLNFPFNQDLKPRDLLITDLTDEELKICIESELLQAFYGLLDGSTKPDDIETSVICNLICENKSIKPSKLCESLYGEDIRWKLGINEVYI